MSYKVQVKKVSYSVVAIMNVEKA